MIEQFEGKFGYPARLALPIGVVELVCLVFFLVPRTAMLGAILLTGYFGGAVATHVRVNDPFVVPAVFGALVWIIMLVREPRLRAAMSPVRRKPGRF